MIQYDENSIYIIGGLQDDSFSNQTWIIDPSNNFNLREGPPLNEKRYYHSCGKMEINGKVILVVAGGGGGFGGYLDSVELMDPASDQGWISGMPWYLKLKITVFKKFHGKINVINMLIKANSYILEILKNYP